MDFFGFEFCVLYRVFLNNVNKGSPAPFFPASGGMCARTGGWVKRICICASGITARASTTEGRVPPFSCNTEFSSESDTTNTKIENKKRGWRNRWGEEH